MYRRCRTRHSERFLLLLQAGETPATLGTPLTDMLLADPPPQYIVVCEASPLFTDLRGSTEGSGVEISEDSERDFMRKDGEGVDTNDVGELVGEERKLGEAAHGQQTLEYQSTARMRRS
jgi:hypothetical protein